MQVPPIVTADQRSQRPRTVHTRRIGSVGDTGYLLMLMQVISRTGPALRSSVPGWNGAMKAFPSRPTTKSAPSMRVT